MRRRILLSLFVCLLGGSFCLAGNLSKEAMKSYKKVCKQLKRDGWTTYDKAQSVDEAMMQYYQQMEGSTENVQQVIGMGRDANPNTAYRKAQHSASVAQASQKGVSVKVLTQMIMSSSAGCSTDVSTFTHTEQNIKVKAPLVSLYRKLKDGSTEINLYYLIGN